MGGVVHLIADIGKNARDHSEGVVFFGKTPRSS